MNSAQLHPARFRAIRGIAIISLLVGVWALRARFSLIVVIGSSMQPTFENGDVVIVDKQSYWEVVPQRGDIVIAREHNDYVLKRIVGLPEEKVEIRQGSLFVEGSRIHEGYVVSKGGLFVGQGRLPANHFGLTGDNRSAPDSTTAVIAERNRLVGKVVARIFSL